jgi:NAD(P)H-dependent FMN reductase
MIENTKTIDKIKILGVGSSMRKNSHSTSLLSMLLDIASKKYDANTRLLDLREIPLPLYNPSNNTPEYNNNLKIITEAVEWADTFVLASPDYHGSMSGVMKNFLDHYWGEFAGKTFGYICSSHEKGLTVMDQMRTAVRQCYGWSLPYGVSVNGEQDFDSKGEINNLRLTQRINMMARDLAVYGALIRAQFIQDLNDDIEYTFAARYK